MASKKISELVASDALTGAELVEIVQGGVNKRTTPQAIADLSGLTREFSRTWSSELLFDKNEIEYAQHELTGDLEYTVAISGHLMNQFSSAVQRVVTDGTRTVTFTGFDFVLGDIQSGSIPDAGTYLVFFLYWNGVSTVNWTIPSLEVANLTPLATPANFAAVPGTDPETEIDITSDAVDNATSYQLDYSTVGLSGPWITIPAATGTSYTHTGLTPAATYYYRRRAIGDGIAFSNSQYATTAATTQDTGDVTPPTFTFFPADSAIDIPVNGIMTITSSAPLRDQDGVTAITDANVLDYLTAVDSSAAAQNITATIDVTKTVITIRPDVVWTDLDDITVTIDGVESSVNGVHAVADDATFTTDDYTSMNGNYVNLGQQINSIVTGNDINWDIEFEIKDLIITTGIKGLFQKNQDDQRSFLAWLEEYDVHFIFFDTSAPGGQLVDASREYIWADAMVGFTEGKLGFKYRGAVDTNNGLDRMGFFIDDVEITAGKSMIAVNGGLTWPFAISNSSANFYLSGPTFRLARNLIISNNFGATVQVNIPIIRTGVDISGNSFDGTWV
jgi:hypothetical protein